MISITRESSGLDGHIRSLVLSSAICGTGCFLASHFTAVNPMDASVFGFCYAGIDFVANYISETLIDSESLEAIESCALGILRRCISIFAALQMTALLGFSISIADITAFASLAVISILGISAIIALGVTLCITYSVFE